MTVADFLIERLSAWGVQRIFGYPGDGINGIMGALDRAGDHPEFILTRHEEMAAFMACAHAKFTNEIGVCLATSGPGAIHLLNGLYDAKLDHQPVLALVGHTARTAQGGTYQQEVDLPNLFKDVASEYCTMVTHPAQLPEVVDRAVRIALAERTVTCLIFPADIQNVEAVEQIPMKHGFVPGGLGHAPPRVLPHDADLERAADILNRAQKVAILVGQGARGAEREIINTAEVLGAGIAKALLGKDVLPDDLPFVTGSIGLLGTRPSYNMMKECDALLMIGSSFPYSEFLPNHDDARGVQIDLDSRLIGIRFPMDVHLVGDSRETLQALLPRLQRKQNRKWREQIEEMIRDWWKIVEERAHMEGDPINPQRLFWELSPRLPDNCILSADSGTTATWYAQNIKIREGMRASLSGTLATMGPGVPYAIAAKFAYPDRVAIAMVGDGAMQMNGINGLITMKQYWKRWSDPRLIILVLHNNDLSMVTWEQRAMEGDERFAASQFVIDFPYARYAELLGFTGIRVDRPDQIADAWDAAFAADRPVIIDAITDADMPILPPHISFEQTKKLFSALSMKGEHSRWSILGKGIRGKLKEFQV